MGGSFHLFGVLRDVKLPWCGKVKRALGDQVANLQRGRIRNVTEEDHYDRAMTLRTMTLRTKDVMIESRSESDTDRNSRGGV